MQYPVDCKVITSASLCAELDGKDIWLIDFTDVMKMLTKKVDLSCNNTTDEHKQGLLNLEYVKLPIDSTSNFTLNVLE